MGIEKMQENCIHKNKNADRTQANQSPDLQRLNNALAKVAELVVDNPIYIPIFERLERELSALDAQSNAVSRARAIALQHQMALASSKLCA